MKPAQKAWSELGWQVLGALLVAAALFGLAARGENTRALSPCSESPRGDACSNQREAIARAERLKNPCIQHQRVEGTKGRYCPKFYVHRSRGPSFNAKPSSGGDAPTGSTGTLLPGPREGGANGDLDPGKQRGGAGGGSGGRGESPAPSPSPAPVPSESTSTSSPGRSGDAPGDPGPPASPSPGTVPSTLDATGGAVKEVGEGAGKAVEGTGKAVDCISRGDC